MTVTPPSQSRIRLSGWPLAAAGLALAVLAFGLAMSVRTPLWLDEAHTYWMIRDGWQPIFGRLAQDVHPPLYFFLASGVTSVFGTEPWALRLVSVLAAAATVPVAYWAACSIVSRPWAFGVALFVGTHPLFAYYAYDARGYALFVLLLTATVGAVVRAATPAAGRSAWLCLVVLLVLLLQAENLALFVFLPLVPAGALLAEARWRTVGLRLLGAEAVAFAAYLPWFLTAVHAEGGIAWIANFWTASLRMIGPIRSLTAFGVAAEYPAYLGPPGTIKTLPVAGAVLSGILLLGSLARRWDRTADEPALAPRRAIVAALWLGAGSLVLLWAYSWIRRPIYLVGRYDLIGFPFAVLLLCLGAQAIGERLRRPIAGAVLLAVGVVGNVRSVAQLWSNVGVNAPPSSAPAVRLLAQRSPGRGDLVVTRGNTAFLILRYGCDRAGLKLDFVPFPAAVGLHPGWYEPEIFLRDRAQLEADARAVAQRVQATLAEGQRVWLVDDGDPRVDDILISALAPIARPDVANSAAELRLFSLRLR